MFRFDASLFKPGRVFSLFIFMITLLPMWGTASVSLAADVPLSLPGPQTFDALEKAFKVFETEASGDAIGEDVSLGLRLVDKGRLLLVAGRVREAALLSEEARLHLEVVRLKAVVEQLRQASEAARRALDRDREKLNALKAELARVRQAGSPSTTAATQQERED